MKASIQSPLSQAPSFKVALTVSSLAALILVLGQPGMTASRDDALQGQPISLQLDQPRLAASAEVLGADRAAIKNEPMWRSDVMDSYASVASLAVLKRASN